VQGPQAGRTPSHLTFRAVQASQAFLRLSFCPDGEEESREEKGA